MVGEPDQDGPKSRKPLRVVMAAAVVGLAVAVLLILVAVFLISWVDGPNDTPPNFEPATVSVPAPAG